MKIIFLGANNPETGRMMRALERAGADLTFHAFLDNDPEKWGRDCLGLPVLGGFDAISGLDLDQYRFVNLITGSTRTRYETSLQLAQRGCRFTNFIHPNVSLDDVSLGVGNYIQEGVILQAQVQIGDNSSIHMGTLVGHESKIGHSVFIAHSCSLSGLTEVGDGTFIGTHAAILPRVKIGKWATIGAGTVVLKDVPDYSVVVGNPGSVIRRAEVPYDHGRIQA
jgi:sugar O-acyltransferase (sialic acid O-acetyltransferase NeuD family)